MGDERGAIEFRVLGPLEARIGGRELALGGAKQRVVLAVLLLRAGEVVPVERLVEEVWGDDPPPSAAHTLESYVSRLRQLFNGHGPRLVRRGPGYSLDLAGATLDARTFVELDEEARLADLEGDHARVVRLTTSALAVWRGPALGDVVLASAGRADADRFEELRLGARELRFDALLALGRHEQAVAELQPLVRQNPYRERFVGQLMLALYRSGRHAEALEVYERLRASLDDDLGLQPSAELQKLSAQIVRQEPDLQWSGSPARAPSVSRVIRKKARRVAELVVVGAVVAATMAITASGGAAQQAGAAAAPASATPRVALVLPRAATPAVDDPRIRYTTSGFRESVDAWAYEGDVLVADEVDPAPEDIERTIEQLRDGGYTAVLVSGGGATARALAPLVREEADTRFVFLDASLSSLSLEGVPNATGMPYADHESSRLAGYVSGLVAPRGARPTARADLVSVVAAPRTPRIERVIQGFRQGVRLALPDVRLRVAFASSDRAKTQCERLANEQADAGSDVILAIGGACSSAALAVARFRDVWGIRVYDDAVANGPHILATMVKWWEKSVTEALNRIELGGLPEGKDLELGLADEYAVVLARESHLVSDAVWSKVIRLCSGIRQHTRADAP